MGRHHAGILLHISHRCQWLHTSQIPNIILSFSPDAAFFANVRNFGEAALLAVSYFREGLHLLLFFLHDFFDYRQVFVAKIHLLAALLEIVF